jgi:hypothetical protein
MKPLIQLLLASLDLGTLVNENNFNKLIISKGPCAHESTCSLKG